MNNAILTYNGIELYQNDIDILCDEYISSLHDESMIYKSTVFSGMLNYIYINKLKYLLDNGNYKNDYSLLDSIFNGVYISLCSKYNICPSIIQFSVLCHIDNAYLSSVKNGVHDDGSKVNPIASQTVKNWYSICESMLLSKAVNESSIGSIFALKANYKYRDNDNISTLPTQAIQITDADTIKERHKQNRIPEKPIFETLSNDD